MNVLWTQVANDEWAYFHSATVNLVEEDSMENSKIFGPGFAVSQNSPLCGMVSRLLFIGLFLSLALANYDFALGKRQCMLSYSAYCGSGVGFSYSMITFACLRTELALAVSLWSISIFVVRFRCWDVTFLFLISILVPTWLC